MVLELGDNVLYGCEWDVCMLVAEGVFALVFMGRGGRLFGHEVCGHVVRAAEARLGVAKLCVLAREMFFYFDVACGGFVSWVVGDDNSAFVVAPYGHGDGAAKTKVSQEHAEVECFFHGFGESYVLSFLGAEAYSSAEFYFP